MFTTEQLRNLYLDDLLLPEIWDGKEHRRVKKIDQWKSIKPFSKSKTFIDLSLEIDNGRKCWFWSDQHFGHHNIIRYSNRPFDTVNQMNAEMLSRYNERVSKDDIVVFGGDIAFMNVDLMNDVFRQMPGYKIQIVGNHDMSRNGQLVNFHVDERHVCLAINPTLSNGTTLLLTHYPLFNVPNKCINIHGHIHTRLMPGNKHFNMSVEHTNYGPIILNEIIDNTIGKHTT